MLNCYDAWHARIKRRKASGKNRLLGNSEEPVEKLLKKHMDDFPGEIILDLCCSEFKESFVDVDRSHRAFACRDYNLIVSGIERPNDVQAVQR